MSYENTCFSLRRTLGSTYVGDAAVSGSSAAAGRSPAPSEAGAEDQRGRQATCGDGQTTMRRTSADNTVVSMAARADCWNILLRRVSWICNHVAMTTVYHSNAVRTVSATLERNLRLLRTINYPVPCHRKLQDSAAADRPERRPELRPSCCTQRWTLSVIN